MSVPTSSRMGQCALRFPRGPSPLACRSALRPWLGIFRAPSMSSDPFPSLAASNSPPPPPPEDSPKRCVSQPGKKESKSWAYPLPRKGAALERPRFL